MKFNKFILYLLLTANIISFTACGNKADDTTKATSQVTSQATAQTTSQPQSQSQTPTQAVTEAVTVGSTQAPTERTTQIQDNAQTTTPTQTNPDVYSVVDSAMSTLAQSEAYKSATKDEQIAMVQNCLNDLENQGYIIKGSIYYSETHYSMFNFRYQNGDLGGFTFE